MLVWGAVRVGMSEGSTGERPREWEAGRWGRALRVELGVGSWPCRSSWGLSQPRQPGRVPDTRIQPPVPVSLGYS